MSNVSEIMPELSNTSPLERIPPQNLEAEQSVLGCLLIDSEAITKIADILKSQDFYKTDHQKIYESILELYEKRQPIDILSLTARLQEKKQLEEIGGRTYLASLVNTITTASHVINYAQIVQKKATLRRLINTGTEIVNLGFQKEAEDIAKILDDAESKLFGVSQQFLKQKFIPLKDLLAETFERIDELHRESGKLRGTPTGFNALDQKLAGLQKSDLIILASRPSMGKTSLALDICRQVATVQKIAVGMFSLEMSKEQLVERMLCSESGVDLWKLRTGRLSDKEEFGESDFSRLGHAMGDLAEAPIFIDDSPTGTIMEIRTKARRLQAEKGLGLLMVDYLQLMEGGFTSSDNRVQIVSEISRGLKSIARELNIPVLALSQLSRQVESRPTPIPKLADLRESGCLAGDTKIFDVQRCEFRNIKDLAHEKKGFYTFSMDNNLNLKIIKAKKTFYSGKKITYKLTTASGRTIKASANHPFKTLYAWKQLDQLQIGERIAVPKKYPEFPYKTNLSNNKLIILAHLIGDGCYLKKQPLHYTSADLQSIKIVQKSAEQEFGVKTKIIPQKTWFHLYMSKKDEQNKKRNIILKWLDELEIFNQHSGDKILPSVIFQLSNKKNALFLKHLWSTDGCIFKAKKGYYKIYYASKNRLLIQQLQHLLLRFGILSTIRKTQKRGYEPNYRLDISGKNDQLSFLKQIGIFGRKEKLLKKAVNELKTIIANPNNNVIPKEVWQEIEKLRIRANLSTREFHKKLGWAYSGTQRHKNGISRKRLKKILKVINNKFLNRLLKEDIYWDTITKIEKLGLEDVYDIELPQTHNFIANDIIVHNSIEQDADVVLFIYREKMYKKDTPKGNQTDIYIAKHRNGPTGMVELYFDEQRASFRNLEKKMTGQTPTEFS